MSLHHYMRAEIITPVMRRAIKRILSNTSSLLHLSRLHIAPPPSGFVLLRRDADYALAMR